MNIKLEQTKKVLSSNAGSVIFDRLATKVRLNERLWPFMPTLKSGYGRSLRKFRSLMLGFVAGADCLDDMDRLAQDEAFKAVCDDKVYSAKAYGDFLRSFTHRQCKELNHALIDAAYEMRSNLLGRQESMTVDLDSTINEQHGEKIEGVSWTYKNCKGLHTIQAFDELGLELYSDVREGNTHTAQGAPEIIDLIFRRMPRTKDYKLTRRYVRADAGYSNIAFFNACKMANAGFVVAMHANMWKPLIANVKNWNPINPAKKKALKFHDDRPCEIGETIYKPDGAIETLRVVMIRAVKKDMDKSIFKHVEDYDYHAFVTNIGQYEKNSEKLVVFYRGRGHAENYIRELKYGLDLKHYPCLKLVANKAYGMVAAFAYNLMRFIALKDNLKKPQFAKAIRFRLFHLPCQVVRHAKQVSFRFMNHHHEEVCRWLQLINKLQFGFV